MIKTTADALLSRIAELAPTANTQDISTLCGALGTLTYTLNETSRCSATQPSSACTPQCGAVIDSGETARNTEVEQATEATAKRTRRTKEQIAADKAAEEKVAVPAAAETPAAAEKPSDVIDDDPTKEPEETHAQKIEKAKTLFLSKSENYGRDSEEKLRTFKEKVKMAYTAAGATRISEVPADKFDAFFAILVNA